MDDSFVMHELPIFSCMMRDLNIVDVDIFI